RRQDPEQPLGGGEVPLRRQQLAEPVQRIGVFRLDLQNAAVAELGIGGLSLSVQFGRLVQQGGDTPGVDPAAQIPAALCFQTDGVDPALLAAKRVFVGHVAAQEVVFDKAARDGVANAV